MIYRHFKGDLYETLYEGRHTETKEELVVYKPLNSEKIEIRPKKMFYEMIKIDNTYIRRFEPVHKRSEL
jgi:hypothetical protein